jgi:hypothetical protein
MYVKPTIMSRGGPFTLLCEVVLIYRFMKNLKNFRDHSNESVKDWVMVGALSAASLKSAAAVDPAPVPVVRQAKVDKNVVFPVYVTGQYTAKDCDALHAFQSRKYIDNQGRERSELVGNMHVKVSDTLKKLHKNGYNVKTTDVDVTVTGMTVNWSVKIEESTDGKSWVGFTSRGAGCSRNVVRRATAGDQSKDNILANVKKVYTEPRSEMEVVDDTLYNHPTNGFRQVFYTYTRPDSFPANRTARVPTTRPKPSVPVQTTTSTEQTVYSVEYDFAPKVLNRIYEYYKDKFKSGRMVRFDGFEINYDKNTGKVKTKMTVASDPKSDYFNFVFVSAPVGDTTPYDRVMSANQEFSPRVMSSGVVNLPDGNYKWYVIGLKKK